MDSTRIIAASFRISVRQVMALTLNITSSVDQLLTGETATFTFSFKRTCTE